jgi:inhibitor of KinA sporulation pathway (predicted exonuclease)
MSKKKKKKKQEPVPTVYAVDIEATCWEHPKDQPAGEKNEIIEIGITAVTLPDLNISNSVGILVRPTHSKVSQFCTHITTLTQELVDTGMPYGDACEFLVKKMYTKHIPWISWGTYDRKQIMFQCQSDECGYPFGAGHDDFRLQFATMMGLKYQINLPEALKMVGLEFQGTRHRAADESWNIARLMVELYSRIRGNHGEKEAA